VQEMLNNGNHVWHIELTTCRQLYYDPLLVTTLADSDVRAVCLMWAWGNFPPYPFTSPPSTLSCSIFYFSLFTFLIRFIYFLAFPSTFLFYQNSPTPFPGRLS